MSNELIVDDAILDYLTDMSNRGDNLASRLLRDYIETNTDVREPYDATLQRANDVLDGCLFETSKALGSKEKKTVIRNLLIEGLVQVMDGDSDGAINARKSGLIPSSYRRFNVEVQENYLRTYTVFAPDISTAKDLAESGEHIKGELEFYSDGKAQSIKEV